MIRLIIVCLAPTPTCNLASHMVSANDSDLMPHPQQWQHWNAKATSFCRQTSNPPCGGVLQSSFKSQNGPLSNTLVYFAPPKPRHDPSRDDDDDDDDDDDNDD
ncbi:unnamed protein product [Periconia digitata]|uniref:Uncharacterized protein n=1 Tax=Periconia digitata TaxID=1303443 RepID=A0A9W4UTT1_9PLEO|nr:unnamed protein product [Periconia digitata]